MFRNVHTFLISQTNISLSRQMSKILDVRSVTKEKLTTLIQVCKNYTLGFAVRQ